MSSVLPGVTISSLVPLKLALPFKDAGAEGRSELTAR